MKNYPNQASSFARIRDTLEVVQQLNEEGKDATSDDVLGYACADHGTYTFRGLDATTATQSQLDQRITEEKQKPRSSQGALTFARELRRTLRDMGWIDQNAVVTADGKAVLTALPNSSEEQALLVEGLLNVKTADKDGNLHHPVPVMLKLLAERPTLHRDGLELALEPRDDSDAEFERVKQLYGLSRGQRIAQLGISTHQRANAVKIFPTLALIAGLVVEDDDGYFSLSQDGWWVIGKSPRAARKTFSERRGRRTTLGKLVTTATVAERRSDKPPRTLSEAEQLRANEKRLERTAGHQKIVKRVCALIGDDDGTMFEDEFSYDLLWVPADVSRPVFLFEMKTITDATDAYARVRYAVGQLSYYLYFHIKPTWEKRGVVRVAAFDAEIPKELAEYLQHEGIGGIVSPLSGSVTALNAAGRKVLAALPPTLTG